MNYPHVKYLGPAYTNPSGPVATRKLLSRMNDGIQVDLVWCERKGRAWVTVSDSKRGERFSVLVPEGERPLDVFHHPYAYAAPEGVGTDATSGPPDSGTALAA
jgi:hypothetical protein